MITTSTLTTIYDDGRHISSYFVDERPEYQALRERRPKEEKEQASDVLEHATIPFTILSFDDDDGSEKQFDTLLDRLEAQLF